jgi:hypothetical protein
MLTTITIAIIGLLLLAVVVAPAFSSSYIPGPLDEQLRMETAQTKTADFNGTTLDLGSGYAAGGPGRPHGVVIQTTALDLTSGNETYAFDVQESADGATWVTITAPVSVTAVGTIAVHAFVSLRYVRARLDVGGTTPSITYDAWLVPHQ